MTDEQWKALSQGAHQLAGRINRALRVCDPVEATNILVAHIIAGAIGSLPDDQWEAMVRSAAVPCLTPECECHVMRVEVMGALDTLRDDWKTQTAHLPGEGREGRE